MIKVGNKRWYVYGYDTPLLIHVTIVDIDEFGIWIDEPLGHEVYEDELYDNLDDAMQEMKARKSGTNDPFTLEEFRVNSAEFILSTRKDDNRTVEEFLNDYPEKIKNVDWFN